jgi:hypothetical protein
VDTRTLIDSYTNDVARRLPRRLRNEVGLELRALLGDELNAAASDAGRAPDVEMTVQVLKNFGRPEEVAARYSPPRGFNVIEPEHAPSFVKLALLCVAVQWALTLPPAVSSSSAFGEWWLGWGLGALWWVGLLTVWYGLAGWIQRRSPVDPHSFARPWTHFIFWVPIAQDWQPGLPDQEHVMYASAKILIPLSALLTIFFVSPAGLLDLLLPASADTSWAQYDADFRRWLLIPLIALMAVRLALFTFTAVNEPWRARTERIRFGLWVGFVVVLIWSAAGWNIFASALTDLVFKAWLWVFLLINCVQIYAWIHRALARVRVPKDLTRPQIHPTD